MHLPKWSRPKWSSRKWPSEQPGEAEDPPPYSQSPTRVGSHIITGIEEFFLVVRGTPRKCWRLELVMYPTAEYSAANPNAYDMPPWVARVPVAAKNLPSLMRYGLYVDEDNVMKRKGHFVPDDESKQASPGQPPGHLRRYFLAEEHPRWSANMAVSAPSLSELVKFKVHELGPDNVVAALGFDKRGNRVYSFSAMDPDGNFNAIYDMPMRGWWPWPRTPRRKDSARDELAQRFLKWKDGVVARETRAG